MFLEKDRNDFVRQGWIEVICGSMFSGKTEELIRRLNRARIAKQKVEVFKRLLLVGLTAKPQNMGEDAARLAIQEMFNEIVGILKLVETDVQAALDGDPAANSLDEIIIERVTPINSNWLKQNLHTVVFIQNKITKYNNTHNNTN